MTPVPLLTASFFRHDGVLREVAPQPANYRILGALVGLRNKINFPLVADFCRVIELGKQDAPGFYRCLYRYFQKLIAHYRRIREFSSSLHHYSKTYDSAPYSSLLPGLQSNDRFPVVVWAGDSMPGGIGCEAPG